MRKLCILLLAWLAGAVPASAVPGQRAFFPPAVAGDSTWVKKVVTGDFDGDRKTDFATLAWEIDGRCVIAGVEYEKGFLVRVHRNTTPPGAVAPTFAPAVELPYIDDALRIYALWASDLTAADFDLDGRDDLLVANTHSDQVFAYRSLGGGAFAPPVLTRTEDDPTYIAAGDYDADGTPDIALLYLSRAFHPTSSRVFNWKVSFLFGDRSGSFGRPLVEDLGNREFPLEHGPFYNSASFQFATAPGGKRLDSGGLLDAVYMNGPLKWVEAGAITTDGGQPYDSFRRLPWSYSMRRLPAVRVPELAEAGGRLILGSLRRLGDAILAQDDSSLGRIFLNTDGSPARIDHFGQAVAFDDFDRDGQPDLVMLSDEMSLEHRDHNSRSLFVAYGDPGSPHPLSIKGSSRGLVDRFKFLDNRGGTWHLGHKAGMLAAGDFNGDGYPDLITGTTSGMLVHTNVGEHGYDLPEPVIQQVAGIDPNGNIPSDRITLTGDFAIRGYRVDSAFLTRVGEPGKKFHVPGTLESDRVFHFNIPPDDAVEPGDYVISVYNGIAESKGVNPTIKIKLRPISILSVSAGVPDRGDSRFPMAVVGWFGNSEADAARGTVSVFEKSRPGVNIPSSPRFAHPTVLHVFPPVGGPATYTVVVQHPQRGSVTSAPIDVDQTPTINYILWRNPDGTAGHTKMGSPPPMQPGATVYVEGSLLRAPDTRIWHLVKGGMDIATGVGVVSDAFADRSNRLSTFVFQLPMTLKEETGLALQLETTRGLRSNAFGTLATGKSTAPGPGKPFWFVAEALPPGLSCTPEQIPAKDEAEAERIMKMVYPPGSYQVTKITQADYLGGICTWDWVYQIIDAAGNDKGEEIVETATRGIADERVKDFVPRGGTAVFLRHEKK